MAECRFLGDVRLEFARLYYVWLIPGVSNLGYFKSCSVALFAQSTNTGGKQVVVFRSGAVGIGKARHTQISPKEGIKVD